MKLLPQKPNLLKFLEANDPKNTLGVQLRIWELSNNTEIVVRIENQNKKAEKLWIEGKERITNGQVTEKVLNFLQGLEIIKDPKNWDHSAERNNQIMAMDEYEDREKCFYYVFYVRYYLIKF